MTISVAIATFNEEKNIARTLYSVYDWVNEIVIVDGGSTDNTIDVVKNIENERGKGPKVKIIRTTNPKIFHINKQKALDACSGNWILQLDADEVVSDPFAVNPQRFCQACGRD